jgi:hypothetical protein
MPLETITLATQTTFAELLQRCLDAEFDELYDERGSFTRKRVKNRIYWDHQRKIEGKVVSRYVGPVVQRSQILLHQTSPPQNDASKAWMGR